MLQDIFLVTCLTQEIVLSGLPARPLSVLSDRGPALRHVAPICLALISFGQPGSPILVMLAGRRGVTLPLAGINIRGERREYSSRLVFAD